MSPSIMTRCNHILTRTFLLALFLGASGAADAQEPESAPSEVAEVEDRDTSFQPSSGASTEQIPGGSLLISAYIAGFAAFALFAVVRVRGKQNALEARLEELSTSLSASSEKGSE